MLDLGLVLFTLLIALVLRTEPLQRLRPLTAPLLLTAAAALVHFLVGTLDADANPAHQRYRAGAVARLSGRPRLPVAGLRLGSGPPNGSRPAASHAGGRCAGVYLALGAILLRSLGVEVTGIIATSAVITVVVGLALQQTLGNLLAGLALAWEQRLSIGTWVEIDGQVGIIEQTGWRSLIIRTRLDERLLVPNADVGAAQDHHPRYRVNGRRPSPSAWVWPTVSRPMRRKTSSPPCAGDIPGILKDPPPRILTVEYADSAVIYECRLWSRTPWAREDITDLFLTRAHQALARAEMEIPFPQRTLHRAPRRNETDTAERRRRSASPIAELFGDLPSEALAAMAENFSDPALRSR